MFKGQSLAILAASLVLISCIVIYLEWRAVSDIRKGFANGGDVSSMFRNGRHALLHQMVREGGAAPESLLHAAGLADKLADKLADRGATGAAEHIHKIAEEGKRALGATASAGSLRGSHANEAAPGRRITDTAEKTEETVFTSTFPVFPTPQEVRHPRCVAATYDLDSLPRASLVIPYLNETWSQIKATVGSLLAHSPLELVDQILFIDDGNAKEWQHHEELKALHPKVTVHRNEQRQGLIRAKVIGAALVDSPVIVFMEPHCIVVKQWLEPLLERLAVSKDHGTLVMPTLDIIPEKNFNQYLVANHHIGGFDWSLTFNWMALIEQRNKSYVYPDPYPTPALSGGIFGIWKDSWEKMGTYDTNMTEWGGEHIEMSLRTWRCGGRIEIVPCSRMGHVFRAKNPYVVHVSEVLKNTKRAALVWLDDHIEEYYKKVPYARNLNAGDVSDRLRLKESLHCKSVDWYIDNIYPELKGTQPHR